MEINKKLDEIIIAISQLIPFLTCFYERKKVAEVIIELADMIEKTNVFECEMKKLTEFKQSDCGDE